jgi:hypothetical protein
MWDYLKHVFVVYYGSHLAGILAVFALYMQGYTVLDAITGGLAVMCIAGICLAVTALWGIRYPARVEPEPRPVILDKPVQDTRTDDLLPMPYQDDRQSYEATMARRKSAPDLALPEPQIARVVMYLLDGAGRASARQLAHICNQAETAKVRAWLLRHRWADGHNSTAVLNPAGREALAELLPHLARE